jgi:hypothetical protein
MFWEGTSTPRLHGEPDMPRKKEPQQQKPTTKGRKEKKPPARKSRPTSSKKARGGDWGEELPQENGPILFPPDMEPMIREGIETFVKELPSLLEKYTPRHWVAYRGRELVGVSKSIDELYAEMAARAIPDEELFYHSLCPIVTKAYWL